MINLDERIPIMQQGVLQNYAYYQDLGLTAIGEYRKNYEDINLNSMLKKHNSSIDFSDDVVDGTQSLVLQPPHQDSFANPYSLFGIRVNLYSQPGDKGLFYFDYGAGTDIFQLYFWCKRFSQYSDVKVRIISVDDDSVLQEISVSPSSSGVNEWERISTTYIEVPPYTAGRFYIQLETKKGMAAFDGFMLKKRDVSTSTAFMKNPIDRTLRNVLEEGYPRFIRVKIGNYVNDTDFTISENSLSLDRILMTGFNNFGGCNASQFKVDIFDLEDRNITGKYITVKLEICSQSYDLFTGFVKEYKEDFEQHFGTVVATDILGFYGGESVVDFYKDIFIKGNTELTCYWDWKEYYRYPHWAKVRDGSNWYSYELNSNVFPSSSKPITFKGKAYTSSNSFYDALVGTPPHSITYTWDGVGYSLTSLIGYIPQRTFGRQEKSYFKGAWDYSTNYSKGNIVSYNGTLWQYGDAMNWLRNGVYYSTLVYGTPPPNVAENYPEVGSDLIKQLPEDSELYDYNLSNSYSMIQQVALYYGFELDNSVSDIQLMAAAFNTGFGYNEKITKITLRELLEYCCQIDGKIGYINESGKFSIISPKVLAIGGESAGSGFPGTSYNVSLNKYYVGNKSKKTNNRIGPIDNTIFTYEKQTYKGVTSGSSDELVINISSNQLLQGVFMRDEYKLTSDIRMNTSDYLNYLYQEFQDLYYLDNSISLVVSLLLSWGGKYSLTTELNETITSPIVGDNMSGACLLGQTLTNKG